MPQIKDISITKTSADNNDFLVLQNPLGETYKIKKSDFLAGLPTSPTLPSSVVFASNFNTIADLKGHTISTDGDTLITTTQSKFNGSSIYFDGSGDWLQLADSADWDFGTGSFTIETWLRPTDKNSNSGHDHVFASTAVSNNSGWQLEINSATAGGNKAFSFFIAQYQNRVYVDDPEWLDEWRYIAVKKTETTLELWMQVNLKKSIAN